MLHDASNIAAVIIEPISGSTGVLPPPKGYLKRLRKICDEYDILLIFDEVISAFGRLGTTTAAEYFGVEPDLITFAKGLTNGVIPMSGVAVRDEIYQSMVDNADAPIELFHGYTYSGHPVATAAAMATLDAYEQDDMFNRSRQIAAHWSKCAHALKGAPHVTDIRTIGLIAGIELESRPGAMGWRAHDAMKLAWERGLLLRVTGDILAFSPPLIISEQEVSYLFDTVSAILQDLE